MMGMQDWFVWESPEHLKGALATQSDLETAIKMEIFGPD
jgi:hypothetical protein